MLFGYPTKYYSVQLDSRKYSEFEDFIRRHIGIKAIEKQLNYLNRVLENFSREGARRHYFREERAFQALPPNARYLEIDLGREQLRLYCLYISENIVFLFNGGVKTKAKAQDCTNVKYYFAEAEKFTIAIDKMIREKQIAFDDNLTKIINLEEIELWLT